MKKFILLVVLFSSCRKDPYIAPESIDNFLSGIVYKNCNGEVYPNEKVVLYREWMGCYGGGIVDSMIDYTDNDGRYFFKRKTPKQELELSTTSFWYKIVLPSSAHEFSTVSPGEYDLYPNDTIMNGFVRLHFLEPFTSADTFYFQRIPLRYGYSTGTEPEYFFTGPFHDTIVSMSSFKVYDVFENDSIKPVNTVFHWQINKLSYYPNPWYRGWENMYHTPCKDSDTLVYTVNPME